MTQQDDGCCGCAPFCNKFVFFIALVLALLNTILVSSYLNNSEEYISSSIYLFTMPNGSESSSSSIGGSSTCKQAWLFNDVGMLYSKCVNLNGLSDPINIEPTIIKPDSSTDYFPILRQAMSSKVDTFRQSFYIMVGLNFALLFFGYFSIARPTFSGYDRTSLMKYQFFGCLVLFVCSITFLFVFTFPSTDDFKAEKVKCLENSGIDKLDTTSTYQYTDFANNGSYACWMCISSIQTSISGHALYASRNGACEDPLSSFSSRFKGYFGIPANVRGISVPAAFFCFMYSVVLVNIKASAYSDDVEIRAAPQNISRPSPQNNTNGVMFSSKRKSLTFNSTSTPSAPPQYNQVLNTKFCIECATAIPDKAKFCPNCGIPA